MKTAMGFLFRVLAALGLCNISDSGVFVPATETKSPQTPDPVPTVTPLQNVSAAVRMAKKAAYAIPVKYDRQGKPKKVCFFTANGEQRVAKVVAVSGDSVILCRNGGPRFCRTLAH